MAAILAHFLCGSPDYMVQFRAFIFGSVMDLYWDLILTKNYSAVDNILKVIITLNIFIFCTFSPMHNLH